MGYQESFRPIRHLAEAAGIRKAIEDYDSNLYIPEYCRYCCATRERSTGKLYACVIGQRCRVHIIAGIDLDYLIPDGEDYADYCEDLDESLVIQAASERPDLVDRAYKDVADAFEWAAERGRKWERALRRESCDLWPEVAKFLLRYGPLPLVFFERHPTFEGHFMWNVLFDLERQGLVESSGKLFGDSLLLTGKAMKMLGVESMPAQKNADELVVSLVADLGPISAGELVSLLGLPTNRIRGKLRKLVEKGIVTEKRGRPRVYLLDSAI